MIIDRKTFKILYGNKYLNRKIMNTLYPGATWLHQVHGHNVTKTSTFEKKADGHFTNIKNKPLVIKTADCMPVFYCSNQNVVALHAGWRGLEQKILTHSVKIQPINKNAEIFIGPHIQMRSFELDQINLMTLLDSHKIPISNAIEQKIIYPSANKPNHFFVNLSLILIEEAKSLGFKTFSVSSINTFTSTDHYSFRRNRHELGRNYSFIIKS